MPDWRSDFEDFAVECQQALDEGERQYGDATMEGGLDHILRECMAECVDLHNYAFMAWRRLRRLLAVLEGAEREAWHGGAEDGDADADAGT